MDAWLDELAAALLLEEWSPNQLCFKKTGGRYILTGHNCTLKTVHNAFEHNRQGSMGFFLLLTRQEATSIMDSRKHNGMRRPDGMGNLDLFFESWENNIFRGDRGLLGSRWGEYYTHVFAKCPRQRGRGCWRWCHCISIIDSILKDTLGCYFILYRHVGCKRGGLLLRATLTSIL